MQRLGSILIWLLFFSGIAIAQQGSPVTTFPAPQTLVDASGTIGVTNTFQSVLASKIGASGAQIRHNCTIQNNGSHTMWVFFGPIANAVASKSYQISSGQLIYCSGPSGITLQDQVSITGTATEAFTASWD